MNNKNLSLEEMLSLAFKNHKDNNFRIAENLYTKIIKINPNQFDAVFLLGSLWFQTKNYKDSIRMLTNAIKINPKNINPYQNLGAVFVEIGESQKAIDVFNRAIKIQPNHPGVLYNLGNAYKDLGKLEKAESYYEATIKLEPRNTKAHNNLGNILKNLRKNEKAIDAFKKAIDIDPKHINAYHNLANTYKELGNFDESKQFYKKSFDLNSNLESLHALAELDSQILDEGIKGQIIKITNNKKSNENNIAYGNFLLAKYELEKNNFKKEFDYLIKGHSHYFLSRKNTFQKGVNYWLNDLPKVNELKKLSVENKDNKKIKPIFIVGVPRCGSTLIEKIIASGSEVIPMGEEIGIFNYVVGKRVLKNKSINDDFSNINEEILDLYKEKNLISKKNNYVFTDKTLDNFFFIALIKKIFPSAKIINCKRNPLSSIISIIKNNLGAVSWAHNLENIFKFFDIYHKKIENFKKDYPDDIYDLILENFVKNPESESKKLMKYCNLPWDKKCLEFYKRKDLVSRTASNIQIRKPIFNDASNKNEKYKVFLEDYGNKYSWFN